MALWQDVLERVALIGQPALAEPETRWVLVGSAATALQGCEVTPRDIDILAAEPAGVHHFASLMTGFAPALPSHAEDHEEWLSSHAEPVSAGPDDYGFYWYFARWVIDGVKVEVAHIAPPEGFRTSESGAGIWEAGAEMWPHVYEVSFRNLTIPVVPLEIQLGTSLSRGLKTRVDAIVAVLRRRGYDEGLLRCALRPEQQEIILEMIQK